MSERRGMRGLISKILFIVGIIIILALLAWAVLSFIPAIFSSLANVGSSIGSGIGNSQSKGNITVLVNDNDLQSGDQFATYWRFTPRENGLYSITYECVDGTYFDIETEQGVKRLICNLPMTLPENTVNVGLRAFNTNPDSFADVPLIVYFTPNTEQDPTDHGQTTVTIRNEDSSIAGEPQDGDLSSATISSEPAPTQTQPQTQPRTVIQPQTATPTFVSRADLAISNMYAYPNQSAFQFDVYNIGGSNSGIWQFSYTDPSENNRTQYSPLQPSLGPGQGMRFSLAFSEQDDDSEVVSVRLDPLNTIFENSEANNIGTVTVTGRGTGGGSNNNGGRGNYDDDDDADFIIEDLEVGRLSGNRFIEDDTADRRDDIAIRFEVRNRGGERTDDWRFEVRDLPYDDDDDYRSPRYDSLRPGEWREIIVEFENIDDGDYRIRVEVDSEDDTDEESERNNTDSVRLEVDR